MTALRPTAIPSLRRLRAVGAPLAALAALLVVAGTLLPAAAIASPTLLCAQAGPERTHDGGQGGPAACPVLLLHGFDHVVPGPATEAACVEARAAERLGPGHGAVPLVGAAIRRHARAPPT